MGKEKNPIYRDCLYHETNEMTLPTGTLTAHICSGAGYKSCSDIHGSEICKNIFSERASMPLQEEKR